MRITLVSRSWPSLERSGLSLAAAAHVNMLVELGHMVSIVGAHLSVLSEDLPVAGRFYVAASGSGALYSPARINWGALAKALRASQPELVVVEAWQTALTEAAVEVAYEMSCPVLMISHGISVHPFQSTLKDRLRAIGWSVYKAKRLPRLIAKLSAITTLAEEARSLRFHDRDLAAAIGVPIVPLGNFAVNWNPHKTPLLNRKAQIVTVGYFSEIKNQIGGLAVLHHLPKQVTLRFIGPRSGSYYQKCVVRARELEIQQRVFFSEDHECSIADEISSCVVLLSTSVTEALPICLLEAMASGTPFVATPVGAVPALGAGLLAADVGGQTAAVSRILSDHHLWEQLSSTGVAQYKARFSRDSVRAQLAAAVQTAVVGGTQIIKT